MIEYKIIVSSAEYALRKMIDMGLPGDKYDKARKAFDFYDIQDAYEKGAEDTITSLEIASIKKVSQENKDNLKDNRKDYIV